MSVCFQLLKIIFMLPYQKCAVHLLYLLNLVEDVYLLSVISGS